MKKIVNILYLQENQLVQVLEKNTELAIQNTDLQKQVQNLKFHGDPKTGNPMSLNTSSAISESDRLDSILKVSRLHIFVCYTIVNTNIFFHIENFTKILAQNLSILHAKLFHH
jgi:hypothetical protein